MKTKNTYPSEEVWTREPAKEDRLTIINEGDFPKSDILNGLGIAHFGLDGSFGITDAVEIQDRLALSEFLLRNPALRRRIKRIVESEVPHEGSTFMDYFHHDRLHNPHWKQVHEFLTGIKRAKIALPKRLLRVVNILKSKLHLEQTEQELGTEVSELLKRSTVVEGHVTFQMDRHSGDEVTSIPDNKKDRKKVACVYGHRHHSASLSRVKARDYEEWEGWSEMKTLGLWWLAKNTIALGANFIRRCSMRTMTLNDISYEMMSEIEKTINDKLQKIDMGQRLRDLTRHVDKLYINVYFCYNNSGLQIRIDSVQPEVSDNETDASLQHGAFGGYSARRVARIKNMQKKINWYRRRASQYLLAGMLYNGITCKDPRFFDLYNCESPVMDQAFKWFAVSKAMKAGDFRARFKEIAEHRAFFYGHLTTLRQLCEILEQMQRKAKSLRTKLCIPIILQGKKQTLIMDGIYPIHLFARKNVTPRPIQGINELNGEMVALTGENASGKTVTELALTDNIFLAQSGLPTFGNSFALTIKRAIGLVFVERGDGSTCELLMRKTKNILKYLDANKESDTLIILDELGTGTTEGDFVAIGKQILRKLHDSNASIIFSTQIKVLAEYAQDELKTRCLQLDRATHQITDGIGDANPQGLAEEVGLTALLN